METTTYDHTYLHPLGLAAMLILGTATLVLPRRFAMLPMIVMACFVAAGQRIVILSLDFNMLRIMVLFGWARLMARGEFRGFRWKRIDTTIILWGISGIIAYTLLHRSGSALINRLGKGFDAIGMYILFRALVRDWRDVDTIVRCFILISIPVTLAFLLEKSTGVNSFSVFGGVPPITKIREGRLRCQGAFAHPILAGCFWATLVPLIAVRWKQPGSSRLITLAGIVNCVTIVVLSSSSTPVFALGLAVLALAGYRVRHRMRQLRWSLLFTLIGLHIVMKAPVWHLISRVDIVGGSTGFHRYHLIDRAIANFREWALFGTKSTAHWGYGLNDVTNQYVLEGVRGGVVTLILFIVTITLAFQLSGRLWRVMASGPAGPRSPRVLSAWAIGAALFVQVVVFIAVSYFGQIILIWHLNLALIASLAPDTEAEYRALLRRGRSLRPGRASVQQYPRSPRVHARQRIT